MKPTKIEMIAMALMNGLIYNFVEGILVVLVGVIHLAGKEVAAPILWVAFAAAALWTVLASTQDAQDQAHEMVLDRDVFITDFIMGAALLLLLGSQTLVYGLQYGAIFLLASVQNLRYTALAYRWLREEKIDEQNKRDNLSRV